jgi:hypothetical protein
VDDGSNKISISNLTTTIEVQDLSAAAVIEEVIRRQAKPEGRRRLPIFSSVSTGLHLLFDFSACWVAAMGKRKGHWVSSVLLECSAQFLRQIGGRDWLGAFREKDRRGDEPRFLSGDPPCAWQDIRDSKHELEWMVSEGDSWPSRSRRRLTVARFPRRHGAPRLPMGSRDLHRDSPSLAHRDRQEPLWQPPVASVSAKELMQH